MGGGAPPCKGADFFAFPGRLGYDTAHPASESSAMDAPKELGHEDVLRVRLEALRCEHRDLDEAIAALQARGVADQLTVVRLKKKKLALKDQIARIQDELTPDIIA